jgi:hypothetical protein
VTAMFGVWGHRPSCNSTSLCRQENGDSFRNCEFIVPLLIQHVYFEDLFHFFVTPIADVRVERP